LFSAIVVMLACASWFAGQASAGPIVAVMTILLAHTLIGVLSLPTAFQALFGLKMHLPFLLGFAAAPLIAAQRRGLIAFTTFVFVTGAIGVGLNTVVEYPWIGAEYETAFGTTSAARQWWAAGGALRLPGFTRASFSAAAVMLVSVVPLVACRVNVVIKAALIGIAGYIIVLTTSKGAIMAVATFAIDVFISTGLRMRAVANAFLITLALICLGVPLLSIQLGLSASSAPSWLGSFMERILDMWPKAFGLMDNVGQAIWGRGTGGIGTAQTYGEPLVLNAADNLFVYLILSFGILGVAYVAVFLLRLMRYMHDLPSTDLMFRCVRGWAVVWITYGLTANMIEEAAINLPAGVAFGIAFGMLEANRSDRSLARFPSYGAVS
jgi:hypothetical protein